MAMKVHRVNEPTPPPAHAPETRGGGWRGWTTVALISFLIVVIVAVCERYKLFAKMNMQGYDLLVKYRRPAPPSKRIVFVDFDETTVRERSAFPIPRLLLAKVLTKISEGKPNTIGLDVLLDLKRGDEDQKLVDSIHSAGNVILVSEYGFGNFQSNPPLKVFSDEAAGVAFGDLYIENDGSVRRMFLKVKNPRYEGLSFPVALATLFSDQHLHLNRSGHLCFGPLELPLASENPDTVWIYFSKKAPVPIISVQTLLAKDFDPSIFADKLVVVGQSSEAGKDLRDTPFTRAGSSIDKRSFLSGAEIHAAAVETLLSGNLLRTIHAYPRWILGLVLGFLVAACGYRHRWFVSVGACAILVAAVFGVSLYLFSDKHLWMPFVSTEICLVLALPAGLGYRSVEERHLKRMMEAERGQIMGLFERYVSPDVAAEIWKRRDQIILAGEERVATILFSDIRSFTAMTCGVPSQEVLAWLNRYLTAMGEVIKQNRGFLNKFIGDGIMVVFGAPLSEGAKEDGCRAVRCALDMLARIDQWNANLKPGEHPLKIGIGIHTGPVTAGNVGSPDRLEYSVIGEAVNLASRLEALTKEYKTPIVISPATWEHIRGQFSTVSLGEAQVRGFTSAIPLYSVEAQSPVEVHS
jgi:adenylate cyclase